MLALFEFAIILILAYVCYLLQTHGAMHLNSLTAIKVRIEQLIDKIDQSIKK